MTKTLTALALLLTLASPAAALDWKPIIAAAAGQLADAAVTQHQINTPTVHCQEANPLLGAHPSTATVLLPKLAAVGIASVLAAVSDHAQNKVGRRVGKGVAYAVGLFGAGLASKNLHTCGW